MPHPLLGSVLLLTEPLVALDTHLLGMARSVRVLTARCWDGPTHLVVALLAEPLGVVKTGGMLTRRRELALLHRPNFLPLKSTGHLND